ncbi:nicotinamidase-related amidase [Filibacter limicola]|uniref:Nicotinamidase-related amidase n=2 Tax=Sporosarcina limicola TaxID=34101 RepID=A0A927MQG3_9BACL|nr:nicotinamidase-related amidase [Sporosarcina limicola]
MMKKALLNIDYTYDFVASEGKLTCGDPGQKLLRYICDLTRTFMDSNDLVVFSIDLHKENDQYHPESKQFPPHNIEHTTGRELYSELNDLYQANKENDSVLWSDKTRFSAFAGTDLELKLRERRINEVHLVGVCTDICILHTAVDAYNKGFKIVIHERGVASFNQAGHNWALDHFKNTLGADVI